MDSIYTKVLITSEKITECKLFMSSPKQSMREHGKESMIEYLDLLREELDNFFFKFK